MVQLDNKGKCYASYNVLGKDQYSHNFIDVNLLALFTSTQFERDYMSFYDIIEQQRQHILKAEGAVADLRTKIHLASFNRKVRNGKFLQKVVNWIYGGQY